MNAFDQMEEAIADARAVHREADRVSEQMARMLLGRLRRGVPAYILADLKRELRSFNIHTQTWRAPR